MRNMLNINIECFDNWRLTFFSHYYFYFRILKHTKFWHLKSTYYYGTKYKHTYSH